MPQRQSHDFTNSHPDVNPAFRAEVERALRTLRRQIDTLQAEVDAIDTGGSGAPTNASYVTISANGTLTAERTLTAGAGITVTDGGANSTVTIATTVTQVTREQVEDWIDGLIVDSSTVVWSYNDPGDSLSATVNEAGLTLWLLAVDIDCTAQAANDWNAGGDGTYSLGGFTWNIVNTGVADTLGPDGSTGVRFNATAGTTTAFTSASRTATHIWILAATLIANFDPLAEYIFEVYFSSITLGTTGDEIGVWAWNASTGSPILVRGGRRNSSGTQQTSLTSQGNTNGTPYSDNAFALRLNANQAAVASGTYSGGFPSPYTHLGSATTFQATPVASPLCDPATMRVGIAWPSNTAGNADSTLARIRVWRRRGTFG